MSELASRDSPAQTSFPEVAPCGLVEVDDRWIVAEVNATMLDWVGRERDEVVGFPLSVILDLRLPLTGDGALPADATLRRKTGSIQPVVVGALERGGSLSLAVFDVSAGTAFDRAFATGSARTRRGQERLQILFSASLGFAETRSETDVAELLADVARRSFAATAVSVHLRQAGELYQVGGTNPLVPYWPDDYRPTGDRTLEGGEVTIVRTPADVAELMPGVAMDRIFEDAGIIAALGCPIVYKGEPLGAMICYFDHPREFDDEAAPLAESLANQAAQAVGRLRLEDSLRRAAMHDDVTGLPNRRLFEEQVEKRLEAGDSAVSVVFIDLDGFKAVNDTLGHAAGDELLREVALRLRDVVREADAVGRFGGDEFIAIVDVSDASGAEVVSERIRDALGRPYPVLPHGMSVSASVGAVVAPPGLAVASDQLIRAADHAMYEAKILGGDRVRVTVHSA